MAARTRAKKKATVYVKPAPEPETEYVEVIDDNDTEREEETLDQLEGLIGEFSGAADIVVNVYRQGEGKQISFLFRTSPDEMSGGEIMERCRDQYGTGDYRVHIRQGPRIVHNRGFSVEAKKEPDPAIQAATGNADIIALITAQNASQQQMFMATMTAMAEALKGREPPPPPDPVAMQNSMINALVALKQLAVPEAAPTKDPIDLLIQGVTLANDLRPSEGDTNANDLVLAGLKAFAPTITEATRQGLAREAAPSAPGAPGATPGQPGAPGQVTDQAGVDAAREREMGLRQAMMKQQLAWLVRQAQVGKHPELYAELLLDQIGERVVLEFIQGDDALQRLAAIEPAVQNYVPWFEALRQCILELTSESDDGHIESERQPINGGDGAARHATVEGDPGPDPGGSDGNAGHTEKDA